MSNKINLTCVLVVSCITAFLKCSLESELPISLGSVHRAPVAQVNTTPNYQSHYGKGVAHEYSLRRTDVDVNLPGAANGVMYSYLRFVDSPAALAPISTFSQSV